MFMTLKQRKIKFKPRIKLNHNIYTAAKSGMSTSQAENLKGPGRTTANFFNFKFFGDKTFVEKKRFQILKPVALHKICIFQNSNDWHIY